MQIYKFMINCYLYTAHHIDYPLSLFLCRSYESKSICKRRICANFLLSWIGWNEKNPRWRIFHSYHQIHMEIIMSVACIHHIQLCSTLPLVIFSRKFFPTKYFALWSLFQDYLLVTGVVNDLNYMIMINYD